MRQSLLFLLITLEICLALFASATWHVGFCSRFPFFLFLFSISLKHRVDSGDGIQALQNWVLTFCATSAVELALYLNVKARANLFMEIKIVEQQQRQMSDLLDLVPDSVFICTKTKGDKQPKSMFANIKMN